MAEEATERWVWFKKKAKAWPGNDKEEKITNQINKLAWNVILAYGIDHNLIYEIDYSKLNEVGEEQNELEFSDNETQPHQDAQE